MAPPIKQKLRSQQAASILVVDNEASFRQLLSMILQRLGYLVNTATNGVEALKLFSQVPFDLVLNDILLPEMDGYALCVELRKRSIVPIMLVSALNQPEAIAHGFTLGADDYIAKPFHRCVVEARIQTLLRRTSYLPQRSKLPRMIYGDLVINRNSHEVYVRGEWVHLSPNEFQLLACLIQKPERSFSKKELVQLVWGQDPSCPTNLVEVTIRRLREKIESNPSKPVYLLTVHGFGYKFTMQGAESNST